VTAGAHRLRLSFFTTCKGRLHQLRQTLPQNLAGNADYPDAEFVVLDYNSQDGLGDWIREAHARELETGRLAYYRDDSPGHFAHGHARNVAALLCTGDVVCNLDADNLTGTGFAAYLANALSARARGVFAWTPRAAGAGTCGRLAFYRHDFVELGGYNEVMDDGWGYHDIDLISRARALRFKETKIDLRYLLCLEHSNDERTEHMRDKDLSACAKRNQALMKRNVRAGKLIANQGRMWGHALVTRNFAREPRIVEGLGAERARTPFWRRLLPRRAPEFGADPALVLDGTEAAELRAQLDRLMPHLDPEATIFVRGVGTSAGPTRFVHDLLAQGSYAFVARSGALVALRKS